MRKLLLAVIILIFAISVQAQNVQRVNTTVNASTWTAISVPKSNASCTNYAWFTADNQSYLIADDSSGTNSTTFPENTPLSWSCMENPTGDLFWVKSTSGSVVFTVLYQPRR